MKVQLRLFAVAKQEADRDVIELTLPDEATVADLREAFQKRFPKLQSLGLQLRFAVNAEFATEETRITPGDDLACIPPVSGG